MNRTDAEQATELASPSGTSKIRVLDDRIELNSHDVSIWIEGRDKSIRILAPKGRIIIGNAKEVKVLLADEVQIEARTTLKVEGNRVQIEAKDSMAQRAGSTIDIDAASVKVNKDGLEVT